jgi:uncharacterized SAM-binding protein YcdF (DUF218 family)
MWKILAAGLFIVLTIVFHPYLFRMMGRLLILESEFEKCDAAVVLNSGVDIYPRLVQAASLYRKGKTARVAVNGNRKNETYRELERMGYRRPSPWYEEHLSILEFLGVPEKDVIVIDGQDAFDTVTEARVVGKELLARGLSSIAITTCKFHSRRAYDIYRSFYGNKLAVYSAPAEEDSFEPDSWWKDPRQIRWVMQEYGGWFFFFWTGS